MWTLILALALSGKGLAELAGHVGPTTSFTSKAANKVCNIVDYGASTNGSDIGDALSSAWSDCAVGGLVYVPPGNYSISTFPELKDGSSSAVQLDGIINRIGSDGDTVLSFRNCQDFELFSGNSKGAIQGYGYEYLSDGNYGPRLMRFQEMGNFSVHGIALIDSPSYYLTLDTVSNDAIDVWGDNVWIHDVEATDGDECVTVKNPSSNFLIESIYCNLSGGNSIGSLGVDTNITDITYRHIYANGADPCFIKSNGGSGTVSNVIWDTVIVHGGSYPFSIDSSWGSESTGGGILYTNFTYKVRAHSYSIARSLGADSLENWHGYNSENSRAVIRLECPDDVPCTDIKMDNVNLWSDNSTYALYLCENVYGSGACIQSPSGSSTYGVESTVTSAPSYATATMTNDFTTALLANSTFAIPAVPTSFFPGLKPSSALLHLNGPAGASGTAIPSSSAVRSSLAKKTTAVASSATITTASTTSASASTASATTTAAANKKPSLDQEEFEHGPPRRFDHLAYHKQKHHWGH